MNTDKHTHGLEDQSGSPNPHKKRRIDSATGDSPDVKEETEAANDATLAEETTVAASNNPTIENDNEANVVEVQAATSNLDTNGPEPVEAPDPEVAAVFGSIIDRAERLEEQFALDQAPTDGNEESSNRNVTFVKASLSLKIQSLPILDNLVCSHSGEFLLRLRC